MLGAGLPGLAQRPVEPRLLLVAERIVELLQRRAHAHHGEQHDVEAIRCGGEPPHGSEERVSGAGTGNELCHGGRVQPQRVQARPLLPGRSCGPFDRAHDPVGSSRRRIGARLRASAGGVRFTLREA